MLEAYTALGKKGVDLFGGGDLTNLDQQEYEDTLKGRNLSMEGAYETLRNIVSEATNLAPVANRDPANPGKTLADIPVYFEHNFTSVGRMQQLGLNSPQSSKLMREVLLPTWANIDLGDREGGDFQYFSLALAQGLGLKVEKMLVADSGAMVREQLDDPAVYGLPWCSAGVPPVGQQDADAQRYRDNQAAARRREHASRFPCSDGVCPLQGSRSRRAEVVQDSLYIEADGVTNGPVNAMAMPPGQFKQWVRTWPKAGCSWTI